MWLFNSSIGRKVVMSLTGIALILFLTFHCCMNLVALFSGEAYNAICEMLGANWYAVVATMGLAGLAVLHIVYAFILTMQNRSARGNNRYEVATTVNNSGVVDSMERMVSKNMLNACYGMMVTDIVRKEILYENDEWIVKKADEKTQLDIYNNSYNRFLFYPWGVWITAYARRNLWSAIFEFGEDYVYTDTDSIKGFNFDKHMNYFEEYNKDITRKLEVMCDRYKISKDLIKPLTKKGKAKPLGHWEIEDEYNKFIAEIAEFSS